MNKRIKRKIMKRYTVTDEILKHAVKAILNRVSYDDSDDMRHIIIWDWRSNQHDTRYDEIELSGITAVDTTVRVCSPFKLSLNERKALYRCSENNTTDYHIRACVKAIIERYDNISRPRKMGKSAIIPIYYNKGAYKVEYDFNYTMIAWKE